MVVTACSSTANHSSRDYYDDTHTIALDEASYAISHALVDLSATAQAAHPRKITPPTDPALYGMGMLSSIEWSGPVEPIVKQIAKAANYRVTVLGNEPKIPIIVTVNAENELMGDILRNIGYQCNRRATILLFPQRHVLELRYAKN
jgi:defect-in-organelle-trafficking protein DotD